MSEPDYHVPAALCWHCDRLLTGAAPMEDGPKPEPGAVSLCMYCGAIGIFDNEMRLRRPAEDELDGLFEDQTFRPPFVTFNRARQYLLAKEKLLGVEAERKKDERDAGAVEPLLLNLAETQALHDAVVAFMERLALTAEPGNERLGLFMSLRTALAELGYSLERYQPETE